MYKDIFIPLNKINKAEEGDKVLVTLQDWPEKADSPYGKVTKVLGKPGEHNTEIHAILADYGLPYDFPMKFLIMHHLLIQLSLKMRLQNEEICDLI